MVRTRAREDGQNRGYDDRGDGDREDPQPRVECRLTGPGEGHPDQTTQDSTDSTLAAVVDMLLSQRASARDARDFDTADRIRHQLDELGIAVDDAASGTIWRRP